MNFSSINLQFVSLVVFGLAIVVFIIFGIALAINFLSRILAKLQDIVTVIRAEIKSSVQPKFLQVSQGTKDFVELAIEVWKLEKKIRSLSESINDDQKNFMDNSVSKLKSYLNRHDVEIREYHEEKYKEGMNIEVLSIEQVDNLMHPIIKETVEPAVIVKGQFINKAKVILLKNKRKQ